MSTSTRNSSTLSSAQQSAVKVYTKVALTRRDQFASDGEWARTFARNFYHGVDSSVGFLPVYHSLLNALYNTVAEKATTVKAHEHPLLPTLQNQSESFAVKMDKLFKYSWPLHAEYRSLDRWAKVHAAQWMAKGNISHKLSEVSAHLLKMADVEQKKQSTPNYVELVSQHWSTRKNFTSNTAWAKVTAKNVYEQLGKKVDEKTIENGLFEVAKKLTAPVMPQPAQSSLTFAKDFDRLAQEALASLHHFTDESAWARATARNFFHQFGATTPFITIYSKLLHYADLKAAADEVNDEEDWSSDDESEHDSDEDYETESEEEEEDEDESLADEDEDYESEGESEEEEDDDLSYTSDESMEKADTLFTPNGKPTNAEANAGRIAMDRILFKQYREWFSAFQEEEDDEFSAEDRFSWHCAKILSNKTGLDRKMCQTVVGGWLELHKNTLATM